jgi:hypothetical protein
MMNYTPSQKAKAAAVLELRRRQREAPPLWKPNPGPQTYAMESKADILGYGGAAGGGKTDLLLGLAATEHTRSVIFRRVFPNLREIIERSREIFNPNGDPHSKDRFNESFHRWILENGKIVEFEASQHEKDRFKQQGRPRDLYGFDEATEFTETQVDFITGWLRSTIPGQRTRIILTFNPPMNSQGSWVIQWFLPWLAYLHPEQFQHPNPAKPGDLRWYATIAGEQVELENGEPFELDGEIIQPLSRTFIPAKLEDNPYLIGTNYRARLQALPEPLRSQLLYGDFSAQEKSDPWQVIPTAWVQAAQRRWMESEKPAIPLSGVGVDLVRGGKDNFALSKRHGTWFDEVLTIPGVDVEDGPAAAGLVYNALADEGHIGYINMDMLSVGSSGYDSTKAIWPNITKGINAGAGSRYMFRDADGHPIYRMKNVRAEYHWRLREALDPVNGDNIALPPGGEILTQLCSMRYKLLAGGVGTDKPPIVQIELKDDIKKRIGKSPDEAEAIMLANFQDNSAEWGEVAQVEPIKSRWVE